MPIYKSKTPTKDGRQFYFQTNYVDNNGEYKQYKSKRFLTKKECAKAEAEFDSRIGEYISGGSVTFNDAAVEFLADVKQQMKPKGYKCLENKVRHVTDLIGQLKIDKLTTPQYQKFINDVRGLGLSNNFLNEILSTSRRLVKHASRMHGINNSVPFQFDSIKDPDKKPREFKIYTLDQYRIFSSVIDDPVYKVLFDTLFFCGLRKGEICALNWNDIDLVTQTIKVNKSINTTDRIKAASSPKTLSSNRTIPISKELCNEFIQLKEYYKTAEGFTEDWFVFGGPFAIPNNTLQLRKKKYYRLAKLVDPSLQEIRIHDFRHSTASFLINDIKAPITAISRYLGHQNASITLSVYSHFYEKDLSMIADEIDKKQKIRA